MSAWAHKSFISGKLSPQGRPIKLTCMRSDYSESISSVKFTSQFSYTELTKIQYLAQCFTEVGKCNKIHMVVTL
jgi:hypothetical protein